MKMIPCECKGNCGMLIPEFDKWGRKKRFVKGHHNRGKHPSDATKQLMSIAHKKENLSDATRQRMSVGQTGRTHSPKTKRLMSKKQKGNKNRLGKSHSDIIKQLISVLLSGENNPNWKGGISKEPYCPVWTKWLKKEIKKRDNFQCQNPNCNKEITKINQLCVHHIDYNKKNCSTNNLITLCRSCNAKANFNREFWKELYRDIF